MTRPEHEQPLQRIIRLLRSPDEALRMHGLIFLHRLPLEDVKTDISGLLLSTALHDPVRPIRHLAAEELTRFKAMREEILTAVSSYLERDDQYRLRAAMIMLCFEVCNTEVAATVLDAAHSQDARQRAAAAEYIGWIKEPAVPLLDALADLLQDPDDEVRRVAVEIPGELGPLAASMAPRLLQMLPQETEDANTTEQELSITLQAATSLLQIQEPSKAAESFLVRYLQDPDSQQPEAAARGLRWAHNPAVMTRQTLSRALLTHPGASTRTNAAIALRTYGPQAGNEAVLALQGATLDHDNMVLRHALEALGRVSPENEISLSILQKATRSQSTCAVAYEGLGLAAPGLAAKLLRDLHAEDPEKSMEILRYMHQRAGFADTYPEQREHTQHRAVLLTLCIGQDISGLSTLSAHDLAKHLDLHRHNIDSGTEHQTPPRETDIALFVHLFWGLHAHLSQISCRQTTRAWQNAFRQPLLQLRYDLARWPNTPSTANAQDSLQDFWLTLYAEEATQALSQEQRSAEEALFHDLAENGR